MSEILNFSCPINSCGRKFATKEKLDEHIKLRHPSTKNVNNNKKAKVNTSNKKDEIELVSEKIKEEIKKMEEKENKNEIISNKNEDNKIKMKNTEEKKEKLQKEKNKIILDDLYSKINSLENYFENENLELQKQFELAEIPNIDDNILLENEKLEQDENEDNNDNENDINNIIEDNNIINNEKENKTEEIKEDKKENIINNDNEKIDNKNNLDLDLDKNKKNYDKDKIITITEDLIIPNSNLDPKKDDIDDFDLITSLNLSKKNIASFMNNRNINFTEIPNLKILNISYNWMTYTYDLRLFINLEELYINDNKIDDISFSEFLPHLKILNCENNEITYITSLKKCTNLKILKLSQNKIQYLNSSLGVFKSLNLLEELTIKDNPFLSNIFAYKQYFLYEFQNLLKFDNEDINEIDRDIAGRFVRQNNTMYKNTPLFGMNQNNEEDFKSEENEGKLKDTFRVGNTIITKEMVVPYKGKVKYSNLNERSKLENKDKGKNKEESDKNKELKDIIKNQRKEIDDIKLELENINQLNKEYEIIIEDYKIKLEQKKSKKDKSINKFTKNNKEEKKIKLLKELDMWKKEYLDLFNKINQSSLFPSLLTNDKIANPKSHLLKKEEKNEEEEEEKEKEEKIKTDLYKSNPNEEKNKEIKRPQTAQVKRTNRRNFEGLCEGLKIMYSKNQFLDVLEEESDDEEEEKEKEKNDNNEIKDEIDYDGNDIIPDDEIDELFRKSCADLQKMKDEIKFMNESIDKNGNNLLNNTININNKGGKMKLNPVIVKKENNPNFLGNKTIFGNLNQKKI